MSSVSDSSNFSYLVKHLGQEIVSSIPNIKITTKRNEIFDPIWSFADLMPHDVVKGTFLSGRQFLAYRFYVRDLSIKGKECYRLCHQVLFQRGIPGKPLENVWCVTQGDGLFCSEANRETELKVFKEFYNGNRDALIIPPSIFAKHIIKTEKDAKGNKIYQVAAGALSPKPVSISPSASSSPSMSSNSVSKRPSPTRPLPPVPASLPIHLEQPGSSIGARWSFSVSKLQDGELDAYQVGSGSLDISKSDVGHRPSISVSSSGASSMPIRKNNNNLEAIAEISDNASNTVSSVSTPKKVSLIQKIKNLLNIK